MTTPPPERILSRLSDEEFFDRKAELDRLRSFAAVGSRHALLLGAPRVGKTELLRKCFDRLFKEGAQIAPVYYCLSPYLLDAEKFSRDFLSQFLSQFIALRRGDARLLKA